MAPNVAKMQRNPPLQSVSNIYADSGKIRQLNIPLLTWTVSITDPYDAIRSGQ